MAKKKFFSSFGCNEICRFFASLIMANFEKEKFEAKTESFWNLYSCVSDFQRQLEFVQTYQVCIWNRARCLGCGICASRRIWGGARSSIWSIQPLDDRRMVYHNNRSPLKNWTKFVKFVYIFLHFDEYLIVKREKFVKLCLHLSYARQISIQFNEFFDFKNVNKKSGEKFVELCLRLNIWNYSIWRIFWEANSKLPDSILPVCHLLHWCLLALRSLFCWYRQPRWFCDDEANTFRRLHLWIVKAKTHYCYRWILKENCYGATSNPI